MRTRQKIISYVFILILALLFAVQWGPGSDGCVSLPKTAGGAVVATVGSHNISGREFLRSYNFQLERLRQNGLPVKMAKQFGVHTRTLEQLINGQLLAEESRSVGFQIADGDVVEVLHKEPAFQRDGVFDFRRYEQTLAQYSNLTSYEYEERIRRDLLTQRFVTFLKQLSFTSDDELRTAFFEKEQTAEITFQRFRSADADRESPFTPSEKQITDFEKSQGSHIAEYYEEHKEEYEVPATINLQEIRGPFASSAEESEVKKRMDGLYEKLQKGTPFSELVKGLPEGYTLTDRGWTEKKELSRELQTPYFALEPKHYSLPIRSKKHYSLGYIQEKKATEQQSLKEATKAIAQKLLKSAHAKKIAQKRATQSLVKLKNAGTFPEGEIVVESDSFTATEEYVPKAGKLPMAVRKFIFTSKESVYPELVPLEEGDFLVVRVSKRQEPTDEDFSKKLAELRKSTLKTKGDALLGDLVKLLRRHQAVEENLELVNALVPE